MRACVCSHGLLRRSFCCFDSQCIVVFCVLFTTTGACACVCSPPVERCIRAVKQVNESVWPVLKRRLDTRRPDGDQKKNTRYHRQRKKNRHQGYLSHRKSPTGTTSQLCQSPVLAGHLSRTPAEDALGVACHVPSHKRGNAQIAYNCVLI